MANAVPLLEGTDASGGYLVEDALGPVLQTKINRESAVARLANVQRINTNKERFPVYVGRPTAAFVGEGVAKGATGAEFTELSVDVKKIATVVLYTDELLADARIDPTVLVSPDVSAAFADLIDSHALGRTAAGTLVSQFNSELTETTSTVELGTGGDALAVAVSSAMGTIEQNGYRPNGVVLATDGKAHLRAARHSGDSAAVPVYTDGFNREPDSLYGLNLSYSTNLQLFATAAAAGRVVGIVGDFSNARLVVRNDITMSATNQATVDVGGTLHHTWQQNKTAVRWEARLGFVAHDINRSFVAILNAA